MKPAGFCMRCGLVAAWCAACAVTAPVSAATIGINGSVLTAFADDGDDVLVGSLSGSNLAFLGISFTVVTPGCSNAPGPTTCSLLGVTEVRINLAGGDGAFDFSGIPDIAMPAGLPPLEFLVLGGDGNDVLLGSAGNVNRLWGGPGDDVLIGLAGGANCLDGPPGDDVTINNGTEAPNCGPAPDFGPAQPIRVPEPHGLALALGALGVAGLTRRSLIAAVPR